LRKKLRGECSQPPALTFGGVKPSRLVNRHSRLKPDVAPVAVVAQAVVRQVNRKIEGGSAGNGKCVPIFRTHYRVSVSAAHQFLYLSRLAGQINQSG
jgi:hypothetical protein